MRQPRVYSLLCVELFARFILRGLDLVSLELHDHLWEKPAFFPFESDLVPGHDQENDWAKGRPGQKRERHDDYHQQVNVPECGHNSVQKQHDHQAG